MNSMKKAFLLTLTALFLIGCSVKEKELEITVFHNTVPSVYTGKVKKKLPDGEGTALLEKDARVKGMFEKGTWISGEAEKVPYSVTFNDQKVSGLYSGEVTDQLPSGNGVFESDTFSYDGTWIGGAPDGSGTLSAEQFCINTSSEVLEGSYSGEVSKGLAEGNGTFIYQDGNHEVEMTGSFSGSRFDGLLVKKIHYPDSDKSYPVYYQNGILQQNTTAVIAYLEGMRDESYCLSEAQLAFLSDHSALFEGNGSDTALSEANNTTFDYEAFNENSTPALIRISNAVIKSIQRYKPFADSDAVTSMIVQNQDGWYHLVFAYPVEDVSQGDTVSICALPLCRSTLTAPEQNYPAVDAAGAVIIGNRS